IIMASGGLIPMEAFHDGPGFVRLLVMGHHAGTREAVFSASLCSRIVRLRQTISRGCNPSVECSSNVARMPERSPRVFGDLGHSAPRDAHVAWSISLRGAPSIVGVAFAPGTHPGKCVGVSGRAPDEICAVRRPEPRLPGGWRGCHRPGDRVFV